MLLRYPATGVTASRRFWNPVSASLRDARQFDAHPNPRSASYRIVRVA